MNSFTRSSQSFTSSDRVKPSILAASQNDKVNEACLFIPGAHWQDNAHVECCSNEQCKRHFSFLVKRHHCRWCGNIFCNHCAPKTCLYHGSYHRRCKRCQLPVIFRSFINPITHERESTPFQRILSYLTPKSITSLIQTCNTMMSEFPVLHYPYLPSIKSRFPSFYDGAQIGKGGFGTVYKCEDRQSPRRERVAIKKLCKACNLTYSMWNKTFTELSILERIHHPHVASLLEVFQTTTELVIVLEAGDGGTVRQACEYIHKHHLPIEVFAAQVIHHVTQALTYLYKEHHIIHRDIKIDNMVVNREYSNVMIIDFGLAEVITDLNSQSFVAAGTAGYASPDNITAVVAGTSSFISSGEEMLKGDVFSLGVIAYMMLTLHRPLRSTRFAKQLAELEAGICFSDIYWKNISDDAKDLVSRMLQFHSCNRISVDEIEAHPFITENIKRITEIVQFRCDALAHEDEEAKKEWVCIDSYDNCGTFYRKTLPRHRFSKEPEQSECEDNRTLLQYQQESSELNKKDCNDLSILLYSEVSPCNSNTNSYNNSSKLQLLDSTRITHNMKDNNSSNNNNIITSRNNNVKSANGSCNVNSAADNDCNTMHEKNISHTSNDNKLAVCRSSSSSSE